jgi:hypothetical protein
VIRILLPHHLRTLAGVQHEVQLDVNGTPTVADVLDALEETYPVLRGTIRDYGSLQRRAFIRFFACGQDITHEPADERLPEDVVTGKQPLRVVGAMAGG